MFADECEAVLKLLIDEGPKTMDELSAKTGWPNWRLNEILVRLLLTGGVRSTKGRKNNRKATFYEYKVQG